MATIIHSFRRDFPLGCGLNAVNFTYNQTLNEEDEYEPDYVEVERLDSDEVTKVATMKEDVEVFEEDEDGYELRWGIDYYNDDDDDDEEQEVERFESNEVKGVVTTKDNKIEGIFEEENNNVFFKDNIVNDNGFHYLTGDEGFQDIYSDYLFMVSEQEDYFLSDFGNGSCDDDHKDEKDDINNQHNSKRRKVSAEEECSDGRRKLESRKDGKGEIVLALAAPRFCPWIDSKGILKKHRHCARKPRN